MGKSFACLASLAPSITPSSAFLSFTRPPLLYYHHHHPPTPDRRPIAITITHTAHRTQTLPQCRLRFTFLVFHVAALPAPSCSHSHTYARRRHSQSQSVTASRTLSCCKCPRFRLVSPCGLCRVMRCSALRSAALRCAARCPLRCPLPRRYPVRPWFMRTLTFPRSLPAILHAALRCSPGLLFAPLALLPVSERRAGTGTKITAAIDLPAELHVSYRLT